MPKAFWNLQLFPKAATRVRMCEIVKLIFFEKRNIFAFSFFLMHKYISVQHHHTDTYDMSKHGQKDGNLDINSDVLYLFPCDGLLSSVLQ